MSSENENNEQFEHSEKNDLNTNEWMKRDWNVRAEKDAMHYIATGHDKQEFWEYGKIIREKMLGNVPFSYGSKIFVNKDLKKMKVLEIGCGTGRVVISMSELFGEAVGVDISKKMIEMAKKYAKDIPNCKFFENNGSDLSIFPNNYFDFCFSFIVFQHIPEKEIVKNYMHEVSRVLKSEGIFRFQVHGDTEWKPSQLNPWYGAHFTSDEMYKIAKENEFEILEEINPNEQYYLLTFKSLK